MYKTFLKEFLLGYSNLRITSDFGKRKDPYTGKIKNHNGIDIGVPSGTVLKAPLSGKIIEKRVEKNGAGLYVKLRHVLNSGEFIDILFMHLHSVDSNVNVGLSIFEGQRIGTTGGLRVDPNAGKSIGAHLHLEVRRLGTVPIDPKYWFLAKHTLISVKTGKNILIGDSNFLKFEEKELKSQASYKFSSFSDITVVAETEADQPKKTKESYSIKGRLASGIWQIIKILIDSSVEDKQVLDSGISSQTGSLLNFFRKVCQEPLVEFMGDTFGSQYYWIVRKPPFDKQGISKMIDLTCIELKSENIISTDLSWNNQGIYSWYQYIPYADLLGIKEANLFIPAVFFPEFASIWGSKPLCVQSNYFNFNFSGKNDIDKKENKKNGDNIMRNAIKDFKFLIESNAYNPFTRRGTITIIGDRRIKRGTLVLHTSGEVFYVDSVVNTYDVNLNGSNRITILNVSKGMYPSYVYGKEINGKKISYFNLIDFGDSFNEEKITSSNWKNYVSKWKVNKEVFSFFMSKQQIYWEHINRDKNTTSPFKDIVITASK